MNLDFLLLLLLIVTHSTSVELSSRWTPVMPMNVKNHRNVSVHIRDSRDLRYDANLSTHEMLSVYEDDSSEELSADKIFSAKSRRVRSLKKWVEFNDIEHTEAIKMHAFIVKDEEIPDCGVVASFFTKTRYYMCSGSLLSAKHVLTSATCMNKAVFFDYPIQGEVGILVGDLDKDSYVIKALDYIMHPKYDPNPASSVHEINNLAVISLSCPYFFVRIPDGKVVFPQLPLKKFDDLAHACCRDSCKLSSFFRLPHNRYTVRILEPKHLPNFDKVHGDDISIRDLDNTIDDDENTNKSPLSKRSIRDNQETFTSQYYVPMVMDRMNRNKFQEVKPTLEITEGGIKRKKRSDDPTENKDLPSPWTKIVEEFNAGNISQNSQQEITAFLKNKIADILVKILKAFNTHIKDPANDYLYTLDTEKSENVTKTVEHSLLNYLVKAVQTGDFFKNESAMDAADDIALRELDMTENRDFFCPAVGTPVFRNTTLVGLVVYTCDEAQNWVAWKYVETTYNTEWIRKQMQVVNYKKKEE